MLIGLCACSSPAKCFMREMVVAQELDAIATGRSAEG